MTTTRVAHRYAKALMEIANEVGGLDVVVNNASAVQVTPVEDPPVANDDVLARAATPTQTIPVATLLANDTDADNGNANPADDDVLAITAVSAVSGGTVALNGSNVVFTFTGGVARFNYTLSDGTSTDSALVTLNDAPVAVDDVASVGENNAYFNTQLVDVVANAELAGSMERLRVYLGV